MLLAFRGIVYSEKFYHNGSGRFEGLGGNVAGGIYVTQPNTILDNLIIRNNNSGAIGGGIFISTDRVVLRNSIISIIPLMVMVGV